MAACRHRVTHTHTSPHHNRPHTARRARVSPGRSTAARRHPGHARDVPTRSTGPRTAGHAKASFGAARPRVDIGSHTQTHPHISLGRTRPDAPESPRPQHGRTQTSRPRAGCSHTQHWATHGRPRQSQLRRSTAACRHRVTHTDTQTHRHTHTHLHITRIRTARHARVSLDAARPHADIQATRGMFPHAALGHARPATPKPASTQHGRVQTSGHTHTHPHITIGRTRPDAPESARTQHSRTQTSRPRAGCSHTQHWATHGRPRQSQLRRSTAACRHRVTHTHTSPHLFRPHTARRARVSPDAAQPHADIQATRGMFPHAALCHARPATPQLSLTQHDRTLTP